MKFYEALEFAQEDGLRIARKGWNGKGMWVCVGATVSTVVPAANLWNKHTKAFAEQHTGYADVLPYMIMRTADAKIQMGWLASQSDLLADDWETLDEFAPY